MERMLGSIFADLHILKVDLTNIDKVLRAQRNWNRAVGLELLLLSVGVACAAKHCIDNKEKIEKLTKEVEELKKSKGE
jgi:hypothetical protein